jgi:hypothetical protein
LIGNRITNNGDGAGEYGLDQDASRPTCFEDWNVFFGNNSGDLNNVSGGLNSYGDHGNHISDPSDDGIDADFNVEDGKEHDSTALVLNWDV